MRSSIKNFIKDKKGAINPLIILTVFVLLIVFFVFIQIYMPFYNDQMAPALENVPQGDLIGLLFEYIPALIAVLIFAYAISKSGLIQEQKQF